jgi:hypothetical protein
MIFNIENQYEFVLKPGVNDAEFVGPMRLNPQFRDVLIGNLSRRMLA